MPASATSTTSHLATTCTSYNRAAVFFGNPVAWASPQYAGDQLLRQAFLPLLTSTPASQEKARKQIRAIETPSENAVKISVNYPSMRKPVNKVLSKEYEALGKALVHGPPSRIATAVMKCTPLTHLVIEKVLRLLKTEVGDLCSKKKPSLLRNCTKEALTTFGFEELCREWSERAPVFYSFLLTACSTGNSRITWLPSMAIAGSILLKQRNPHMNVTASITSLLQKTKSIEV